MTSDWVVCLYDEHNAAPALISEILVPLDESCGGESCWDFGRADASWGKRTIAGDLSLQLRDTRAGKRSIRLRASGDFYARIEPMPEAQMFAQQSSVRIQLVDSDAGDGVAGRCWESSFDSPARHNSETRFTDRIR